MPRISIIMGIYNCSNTLDISLKSIFNQTYTDWEIIMCDDGSSDDTFEIAKKYQIDYPEKVVLLKNERNMGVNATLNKCLKMAKGEYIARQDGDDISLPDRFKKEIEFLDLHKEFAFVSTHMSFFDETGIWGEWKTLETPSRKDFLKNSPCFCHAPCMIRKQALIAVDGYTVEERFLRCEDINLWYKLYAAGYKGYNIQQSLYMMKDDRNAYSRRTKKNRLNIIRTELDGMKKLNCRGLEYRYFFYKSIRHLILSIIPEAVYMKLHRMRLNYNK